MGNEQGTQSRCHHRLVVTQGSEGHKSSGARRPLPLHREPNEAMEWRSKWHRAANGIERPIG